MHSEALLSLAYLHSLHVCKEMGYMYRKKLCGDVQLRRLINDALCGLRSSLFRGAHEGRLGQRHARCQRQRHGPEGGPQRRRQRHHHVHARARAAREPAKQVREVASSVATPVR